MRISELDEIEKGVLLNMITTDHLPTKLEQIGARQEAEPRPGERIQEFWCDECQEMHRGSVLGGPIGDPHGGRTK